MQAKFTAGKSWKLLRSKKVGEVQFEYVVIEQLLAKDGLAQIVAANHGVDVKNFDSIDAALKWLGNGPMNRQARIKFTKAKRRDEHMTSRRHAEARLTLRMTNLSRVHSLWEQVKFTRTINTDRKANL